MRETIARLKTAIQELHDFNPSMDDESVVVFKDGSGRWIRANAAAISLFQLQSVSFQGKTDADLAGLVPLLRQTLDANRILDDQAWSAGCPMSAEQVIPDATGALRVVGVTRVPVFMDDGERSGLIMVAQNMNERRQTEEFLRRADKVSAVSQLASGVAHEIRNPLAAIQWNINVLMTKHPEDAGTCEMILSELTRIDSTVGQLLSLSKSKSTQFKVVNPVELTRGIVRLMSVQALNTGVTINFRADSVPMVKCDENQLKQLFVNLLINSLDAMPEGGTISVVITQDKSQQVRFRFTDSGVGIPPENLSHLGEPFFTTKANGTGLGLMICHKIIDEHNGQMHITSQVGQGTTVDIVLPASRNER